MTKVQGVVDAVSDHKNKDYYNLAIDDADSDDAWYIGSGSTDAQEGDVVHLEVENNSIKKIDIIEEASEGGQSAGSNASKGGDSNAGKTSSNNMSPRQEGITANSAVKLAVENAETDYTDEKKAHLDEVDEKSQAYSNMIQDRLREIQE